METDSSTLDDGDLFYGEAVVFVADLVDVVVGSGEAAAGGAFRETPPYNDDTRGTAG